MFQNKSPRYEILSQDAMAVLDKGWRRIVSEMGIEFMHDRALEMFRAAGQKVEGNNVKFDPDWILAQVAKAPRNSRCKLAILKITSSLVATIWFLVVSMAPHSLEI